MRSITAGIVAAVLLCPVGVTSAADVVFEDTFDLENGGVPTTNLASFSQWSVASGTVDLIGDAGFGVLADIYPGNGLYVDLDGSTRQSGSLVLNTPLILQPGLYELSFELGDANFAFGQSAANEMLVTVGSLLNETFVTADASPGTLTPILRQFTVTTTTSVSISFENLSPGDNFGMIIDDVRLVFVPSPGSASVLAVIGVATLGRRRRC